MEETGILFQDKCGFWFVQSSKRILFIEGELPKENIGKRIAFKKQGQFEAIFLRVV